jgi:carboxypeptidase Taq
MIHDSATRAYRKLCERFDEVALLSSSAGLLSWDQETGMPPAAGPTRARQLAYLGGRAHELATADDIDGWLADCEAADLPKDSTEAANVRNWRRDYDRATRLPTRLVEELAAATSRAQIIWQQARQESDFHRFEPALSEIVELTRQKAEAWGYASEPYDALLEDYERGATALLLGNLFEKLEPELVELVAEACGRPASAVLPTGHYPIAEQQRFNREVAEAIGFDFNSGRIDTAAHPFCSGLTPGDTRLTTRYLLEDPTSSLFGVLHEVGHGLYEQGLLCEEWGHPAGTAVSLGIHESQSRLWENHVGRSRAFWETWLPRAQELFPPLRALSVDEMVSIVNTARRSHIRVEADEATYDLHILLRFRLERALFNREIEVRDLPDQWNTSFENLFGIAVPDDSRGCLQDIHWSAGLIGYFPTYTLGNLNAAQLFRAAVDKVPAISSDLAAGNYSSLLGWLRERIHQAGSSLAPGELIQSACGNPTDQAHHLHHLRQRYLA